jgi:alpha-amylase/alpha-mannosidase (GH57 family)
MFKQRVVVFAALLSTVYGCNCGSNSSPDGGIDAGTDAGADAGTTEFKLSRAYTADGTSLIVSFEKAVQASSVQASDFSLSSASGAVAQTVTGATVSGADVTLTLSAALPKGPAYEVGASGIESTDGDLLDSTKVPLNGTLFLALVWHQHQPVYIDPSAEWQWSRGPWVRKHATKDYYDMVAMLEDFPEIHVQVNLTPVLLSQLEDFYIARLEPYVDTAQTTVDIPGYFGQRPVGATEPVTDPWLDMLLSPTPDPATLTEQQKGWFYRDIWSNFSISEVMIARFPDYAALNVKRNTEPQNLTQEDLRNAKIWYQLAWFDPRFLRGPVTLPDGLVVDLSDLVTENDDGTFGADVAFTEAVGQRLVAEEFKVLKNVVAAHRALMYDATTKQGQVEVMTTPFYHPILPLIADTDLTAQAMPGAPMPSLRFLHPDDANVHVAKAVKRYRDNFGRDPTGMWPAEGSVAEAVVPIFAQHGIRWIATDRRVLEKSTPASQPIYSPYRIDSDTAVGDNGTTDDELAIVFRDTEISDKIGFHYQGKTPAANVEDLLANLRRHAPRYGSDGLLTIILDGENAWEWYSQDNDAIGFLEGMYSALTAAQQRGEMRTVTVSEYLDGNAARNVPAHPVHDLPELEPLFAASWISGTFSTWIGEEEENLAWDYLSSVRADLAAFEGQGLTRPDPMADPPTPGTTAWYRYRAWESMYAAEGSDWWWWYGGDQTAAGGDGPFDRIYLALLEDVYRNAKLAGIDTEIPDFAPILRVCNPPSGALTSAPTIDGVFNPDDGGNAEVANEWTNAGSGVCQDVDSGTTSNPNDVIGTWYHGVTTDFVWLALRMNEDVSARLGTAFKLRTYFSQKHIISVSPEQFERDPKLATTRAGTGITFSAEGAARELTIDFSGSAPTALLAVPDGSSWGAPAAAAGVVVQLAGSVIELKIPRTALNWQANDPLEMLVTAVATTGTELDRAPNLNSIVVAADRSLLVEVTLILDATGSEIPLNAVNSIANPPPPAGTGKAFIVGNQPALANWTPNSIQMADDGTTHGDTTAGDNLWTFRMLVPPATELNYKYTIGAQGQGWGGTEEYPLTNRGLLVSDTNSNRKMVIKDIFADRPEPSGSLGPQTEITDP